MKRTAPNSIYNTVTYLVSKTKCVVTLEGISTELYVQSQLIPTGLRSLGELVSFHPKMKTSKKFWFPSARMRITQDDGWMALILRVLVLCQSYCQKEAYYNTSNKHSHFQMQNVYFQNGRQAVKQPVYIYYNCSYNKQIKDPSRMMKSLSSIIFSKFQSAFKNIKSHTIV